MTMENQSRHPEVHEVYAVRAKAQGVLSNIEVAYSAGAQVGNWAAVVTGLKAAQRDAKMLVESLDKILEGK